VNRFGVIATLGLAALAGCTTSGAVSGNTATTVPLATVAPVTAATGPALDPTTVPASDPPPTATVPPTAASGSYAPAPVGGLPSGTDAKWKPVDTAGGAPVLWTTTFHPLAAVPSVWVTAAVIDQDRLAGALYNGFKLPGGGPWTNSDHVGKAAQPSLVLAFNGGFLFKHITGGYFTEGKEVKTLTNGQATLGVRKDGHIVLGIYGKDMTNDGTWLSLRQNLPPIVDGGKNSLDQYPGTYWGNDFHNVDLNFRSAICNRTDGKLMYIVMGMVRINTLADELARLGCTTAMELDINGHWPQFVWFQPGSGGHGGSLLDPKMWKPERYVTSSEKDFIAMFDPATLPAGAVYSGS